MLDRNKIRIPNRSRHHEDDEAAIPTTGGNFAQGCQNELTQRSRQNEFR
jgi:hypothetical protein